MSRAAPLRRIVTALTLTVASVLQGQTAGPGANASPACASARHREFDFWIGDWDVRRADGAFAGRNMISRAHGGCVLEERYTGVRGYSGASLNIYDASRGRWHQTWVDSGGLLLELDGELRDGRMVLRGEIVDSSGRKLAQRITWEPRSDGKVRQHWEQSPDAGATWATVFDGIYTRRQ
jgi:hypothetical protein